jgi:RHS repeat-associated protein
MGWKTAVSPVLIFANEGMGWKTAVCPVLIFENEGYNYAKHTSPQWPDTNQNHCGAVWSRAARCDASGDWAGELPVTGSQSMQGIYGGNYIYTITCENAAGSNSATVLVTVAMPPPTITLLANGQTALSVSAGKLFLLAWNTDEVAEACVASGAWGGERPLSGSAKITPCFDGTYDYNLTCTSIGGASSTQTVRVTVGGEGIDPPNLDAVKTIEEGKEGAPLAFTSSEALMPDGDDGGGGNPILVPLITTITRKTYSVAGQAVAVRVSGDPDEANNGLFYIHSDHLGSASAMSDENGAQVGTTTRYTPFGRYRSGGPNEITDRAFTGQRENMSLGLYYYNARYYLPGAGHFLSTDTIVPNKENPQALNRYSYTANNPLKFVDASGHCWGFAGGLRDTFYQTTCENIDMAVSIIQHPDASAGEKALAVAYVGTEAVAHGTVFAGTAVAAVGCFTGAGTAVCAAGGTTMTAASADGDPTNEVAAAANSASSIAQVLSADGDPTNEVTTLYRFADGVNSLSSRVSTSTVSGMSRAELQALAEKHMMGTNNSPFVSTLLDPAKGAMTTDPWLQGIIRNPNNSLYVLRVPNHLLYYPKWSLAQAETEALVLADSLVPYVVGNLTNPFVR